jgi:hypothetical protein
MKQMKVELILNDFSVCSTKKISSDVVYALESYIRELNEFFEIEKKTFVVNLISEKMEFDKIRNNESPMWLAGICSLKNGGEIYIYHPDSLEKYTIHKKEDFFHILKHELVHLYFHEKYKNIKSLWINEGLAVYLSQRFILKDEYKLVDDYIHFSELSNLDSLYKHPKIYYKQSGSIIKFMIEKFGKNNLFKFLEELSTSTNEENYIKEFEIVFYKHFGFHFLSLERYWIDDMSNKKLMSSYQTPNN